MTKSCFFSLFLITTCLAASGAEPERRTGIAAIANDAIITIQEVEMLARSAVRGKERLPQYRNNPELLNREFYQAQSDAVEQLIERQLILDDFKTSGLVFPESIIDERIRTIVREKYGSRADLTRTLQADGITTEGFRQQQREEMILRAMMSRNVREALIISPAKIERYYQTNLTKYKLDDQVKLRGIVLKRGAISTSDEILARALEIHRKLREGAGFADMAATYSEGSQARDGGDWGMQESSKWKLEFAEVAASLDAGKHSGIFSMSPDEGSGYWIYFYDDSGRITRGRRYAVNGGKETFVEEKPFPNQVGHTGLPAMPAEFYLLKVDEKKTAHTRPLNELRDEIERDLLVQEQARLRTKWVDRLKAKSFVRRF